MSFFSVVAVGLHFRQWERLESVDLIVLAAPVFAQPWSFVLAGMATSCDWRWVSLVSFQLLSQLAFFPVALLLFLLVCLISVFVL